MSEPQNGSVVALSESDQAGLAWLIENPSPINSALDRLFERFAARASDCVPDYQDMTPRDHLDAHLEERIEGFSQTLEGLMALKRDLAGVELSDEACSILMDMIIGYGE